MKGGKESQTEERRNAFKSPLVMGDKRNSNWGALLEKGSLLAARRVCLPGKRLGKEKREKAGT